MRRYNMKINAILYNEIKCNNNMITTARVEELGFSRGIADRICKARIIRTKQTWYLYIIG